MLITQLHKLLTQTKTSRSQLIFWFSLSLTFSCIYALLALQQAFSSEYIVQDDARQHVFWMQRFSDPELFPNDLIANYFQSVAPWGYTTLYQLINAAGIEPMMLHKLLPMVLGLITTGYCFACTLQILPIPAAGFLSSLLLNQSLWMKDDLISATPRAFVYPLFVAFLYYLLRRSFIGTGIAIALLGLFYPQYVFICAGLLILQLINFSKGRIQLPQNRKEYWFCAVGLAIAFLIMLPYALNASEYGPVITPAEARILPEFLPKGRTPFFHEDPLNFWLDGRGSGILPSRLPIPIWSAVLLPILLRYPSRFPLLKELRAGITVLPQILLASLAMFLAAHAVLFKLHLPSRYTQHSLRIVLAIAAGITLIILLEAVLETLKNSISKGNKSKIPLLLGVLSCVITVIILIYPSLVKTFPKSDYAVGQSPALYEFFQQQPKDTLLASIAEEANNIPSFSGRSILVGREYAIPYHAGYYRQFRERVLELIEAQYSQDLAPAQQLIQKYKVDFWLLDNSAFRPEYITANRWRRQYQVAIDASNRLQQGAVSALSRVAEQCSVFNQEGFIILPSECIVKAAQK